MATSTPPPRPLALWLLPPKIPGSLAAHPLELLDPPLPTASLEAPGSTATSAPPKAPGSAAASPLFPGALDPLLLPP